MLGRDLLVEYNGVKFGDNDYEDNNQQDIQKT